MCFVRGQQDIARAEGFEHVCGGSPVMGLALGQFQVDGAALRVHQRVDLGGQAAA